VKVQNKQGLGGGEGRKRRNHRGRGGGHPEIHTNGKQTGHLKKRQRDGQKGQGSLRHKVNPYVGKIN